MDTFIINEIKEEPAEEVGETTMKTQSKTTKPKSFKCDFCEKLFSHNCFLQLHMKIHTGDTPFHCTICPKKYVSNARLKVHLVSHSGLKPFKCGQCDKSFPRKGDLKKHEPMHTGIKSFKCDQCELAFRQMKCLKVHAVIMHSGEKPFKCELCDKAFVIRNYLDRHKLTHRNNSERPHKCDQCDKTYKDPCHLRRHKRTSCQKNLFKCSLCNRSFLLAHLLEVHMKSHITNECVKEEAGLAIKCEGISSGIKRETGLEMVTFEIKEEPDLMLREDGNGS